MARGWESKEVESQIEAAASRPRAQKAPPVSEAEMHARNERECLESRKNRVVRDLEVATHPRYREQLEAAIVELEQRLAALNG